MRHIRDGFMTGLGGAALWLAPDALAMLPGPAKAFLALAGFAMAAALVYAAGIAMASGEWL